MGKAHQNQKKSLQPKSEINTLAPPKMINSINRKQTPSIQSSTSGIQLCGTTSSSNIEILYRFQSKTLRSIPNAPWYLNNHRIHDDLQMNTVLSEIKKVECQIRKEIRKPY
jgi:hypothetical protein